jgi:hypothetical protein
MKLNGLILSPGGELIQHEFKGPPDFEHWSACWEVYATAMIMLGACSPPHLLAYAAMIGHYAKRYGMKCWALIYQMETRFRRETMERARRRASSELDKAIAAGHRTDFDPARPWDFVFMKAAEEVKYWHVNIEEPAMLIITGSRATSGFLDGDAVVCDNSLAHLATHGTPGFAFVADSGSRGSGRSAPAQDRRPPANHPPPKRQAILDIPGGKRQHNVVDGKYTTNRAGVELCILFNSGSCSSTKGNPVCPVNPARRHNCSACLGGDHGAHECKKQSTTQHARTFATKGKGNKRK